MLWCLLEEKEIAEAELDDQEPPPKRHCSSSKKGSSALSKGDLLCQTINEVDEIVSTLSDKHPGSTFTVEQFRAWAHMIHLKKHSSYDEPPEKPFF